MNEQEKRRKVLGERIRIARTEKEWSRRCLADIAGVSVSTIYVIETGKRGTNEKVLARINQALGTDFDASGRKRVAMSLTEAAKAAREAGMTYGKWVLKQRSGECKQAEKK